MRAKFFDIRKKRDTIYSKKLKTGLIYSQKERGMVALFSAIVTVAIMSVVFAEYQYDNIVHLQVTQNVSSRMKAKYLAQSGVRFSLLLLNIQKKFIDPINQKFKFNYQLWSQIPISGELLSMLMNNGGSFLGSMTGSVSDSESYETDEKSEKPTLKNRINDGVEQNRLPKDSNSTNSENGDIKFERMFQYDGDFYAEISDENSKYSVNYFSNKFKTETIKLNLVSLFNQPEYKTFFEQTRENEQVISPEEVAATFQDWVDGDDERSGFYSGAEDDRYNYLKKPYRNKNGVFSSFDELYMIYGVDDDLMSAFGDSLTIYGSNEININTCDENVLRSIIFGVVKDIPQTYLVPYSLEMNQLVNLIIEARTFSPFGNANEFYQLLNSMEGIKVDNTLKNRFKLTTKSTYFKITSYGSVDGVVQKVTAVVNTEKIDSFVFYKEE